MVPKSQRKEAQVSKGQSKDLKVSKAQMNEAKFVQSNPAKKMRFTSTSEKESSSATFDEEPKSSRGINTMSRVVKRKIQKIKPVVVYNKRGRPHGKAAVDMQSYIGVLTCTRVLIGDKKWTQLPKEMNEQIWEAVEMAYVVGQWGKKMVLLFVAKNLNEKPQWDAFVASRLSPEFEAVHSEQSQRREKCEYNHMLSRKGYVSLEDELEETMSNEEIDRYLLWKKAREDKQGNIPYPKVAEKAKLIESVMEVVREETMRIEARVKESVLEAVRAKREIMLKQFSQLIPNFDPNMLKTPITQIPLLPQEQSPKNPMFDKASCSGATNVIPHVLEEENAKHDADAGEKQQVEMMSLFIITEVRILKQQRFFKARLSTFSVSRNEERNIRLKKVKNKLPICPDLAFEKTVRPGQTLTLAFETKLQSVKNKLPISSFLDPDLAFEKKFDKKKEPVKYVQVDINEVRLEWAEFVTKQVENNQ
ncbi:unnamed protein product [Prunus armeniaca]